MLLHVSAANCSQLHGATVVEDAYSMPFRLLNINGKIFIRSYDPESYAGSSLLLVGSPMPDRSKVMTQTKRDTLALQVGGR